jgi:autotransporter-associated beta strand protein
MAKQSATRSKLFSRHERRACLTLGGKPRRVLSIEPLEDRRLLSLAPALPVLPSVGPADSYVVASEPSARLASMNLAVAMPPVGGVATPGNAATVVDSSGTAGQVSAFSSPGAAIGTWSTLTSAGSGAQVAMLLSDGSVMYQVGANNDTKTWDRLAPNTAGNYSSSTSLTSMHVGRLFFGSAVLPDGRVWVVGGEYSTASSFTNTSEIFSPTTGTGGKGTWTNTANFTPTQFGDDPVEVLSSTQVLAGYISGPATYLYNPTTNVWTATGTKLRSDDSDEETWVKLPDGSILSYDVFSSISTGVFHAQRYVPSTGMWVDASNLSSNPPHILSDASEGYELGPGLLLPNGNVFLEGANGYTAYYNPTTGLWSAGPMLPTNAGSQLVAADAPAAMLPNGDVLMALSPLGSDSGSGYNFPSPTYFYEFNPNDDSYTYANQEFSGDASFLVCMLDLPNGQVLVTNESTGMYLYTPSGSPQSAWRPTVTGQTSNGSGIYTLTGTQFNGMSEGASYGDDNAMASNYPIVQFKDSAGNISYGRTANWSSVGVATGSTPVTTQVTLPIGHTAITDFTSLAVIANGISSPSYTIGLPTVTSLSVSQGRTAGGTTVTINGTNLASVTSVSFGATAAVIVSTSATQIVVTSPAGASGTVDVTATSWFGTSATGSGDRFTFVAPPTVTADNIHISGATGTGGAYRVGDVVTASWNNTASGDNNAGIASVVVDFSQFGGPTSASAANNSNTWTASYTITAGSIDASNCNVVDKATNTVGDVATTSGNANAVVDNIPPVVTAANINISGASGPGGAFQPGDSVTASWNNTVSGDNNTDTIAGVSVNFSQFGGPTAMAASNSGNIWTATYTILPSVTAGSNRNVIVTATEDAGNSAVATGNANATIVVPPSVTTNPTNQTVNAGGTASFTAAASGGPTPTVQWQVSVDGGVTWNAAPGTNNQLTYTFSASTSQDANQYEAVFTNTAGSATTSAATLTVDNVPSVTASPTNETVSTGDTASFSAAASGKPAPGVLWEVSADGGTTWNAAPGTNNQPTYSFTASPSQNGNEYEAVFTNPAGSATTSAATLTVDYAPSVTMSPTNQTVNSGATATFTAAASGNPPPGLLWEVSADGGTTWNAAPGTNNQPSYSFTASASQNGYQYEAVFTNTFGSASTSAATLTVDTAPTVTTSPTNQTVVAGGTATFTAAAGGNPTPGVLWEVSADGGATWNSAPGADNQPTYSFTASAAQNGYEYEAIFTNSAGSTTTSAATLTVDYAPSVTTSPTNQTVNSGGTVTFTAAASCNPAPTLQWEVSADGGATWNAAPGTNNRPTYSFTASASQNGYQYEAVFTNTFGGATTSAAILTVDTAPSVTASPTSQTVNSGGTANFTAAASGNPPPAVLWEVSADGGTTWNAAPGTNNQPTYSVTASPSQNGYEYEAVFTNTVGNATTSAATLTVDYAPSVTTSPTNQTVNSGGTASFTATAVGNPPPGVLWEVSADGGTTWNTAPGTNNQPSYSFTASASQNGYEYEAVFTNTLGNATTSVATLTVDFAPTVTLGPTNQTVNSGGTASFTATAVGNPPPGVLWEVSADGGTTWNTAPGTNNQPSYGFTASASQNGYEYEAVFTNTLGIAMTSAATLTVDFAPSVTTNPTNQTVNSGGTASFTAAASGNPAPAVQWDVSTDGGATWNAAPGANNQPTYSFAASAFQNGYEYEAVFTNSVGSATTTPAALSVDSIASQPVSQTVNAGQTASFSTASSNPGGSDSVEWYLSTDGGATFNPIPGAIATTYSFTASASQNGYQYEAVFQNASGTLTTAAATLTVVPVPAIAAWNSAVDGFWNSAGNWNNSQGTGAPGFSGLTGDVAAFNGAAGLNVDLGDSSSIIAGLIFGPIDPNYIIKSSGNGHLQFANGGNMAAITVSAGSQTISAPVDLLSGLVISPAAGSQLTISGGISGAGQSLTVADQGTVELKGANSYSGGTNVSAGKLVVDDSSALASGTDLTVGAAAASLFGPAVGFGNVSGAAEQNRNTAIQALDAVFAQYGR